MAKGWVRESARHALARKGVKTKGIEEDPQRMWNVRVMAHADAVQKAEKLAKKEKIFIIGSSPDGTKTGIERDGNRWKATLYAANITEAREIIAMIDDLGLKGVHAYSNYIGKPTGAESGEVIVHSDDKEALLKVRKYLLTHIIPSTAHWMVMQPFALKHENVKEGTGETYQYDVLGQFYGTDRGGEKVGKLYQRYYKGREAAIVWMSPDEYFNKINKGYKEKFPSGRDIDIKEGMDKEEVKKLAEAMKAGDKFAMPWIDYRQDKFSGYEGKHRVAAAKLLGIEKIPIVVNNQISESEDHRAWMAAKERYGIKTD